MRNNLVVLPDGDSPSPRIEVIRDSKKMRNVTDIQQAPQHKPFTQVSVKNTAAVLIATKTLLWNLSVKQTVFQNGHAIP